MATAIRAEKPLTGKPRGRPVQPALVKWVAGLRRAALTERNPEDLAAAFAGLTPPEQASVRAELLAVQARVQAVLALLAG